MGFRENLRETIDFYEIEQKELAHKANLSIRNIENYLKENPSIPSADKAVRIAQVLGVTVEYLVTGKDVQKEDPNSIDNQLHKLMRLIKKLPIKKQNAVIQNFINLVESFSIEKK